MSCPDCFSGHINPGTPQGHVTALHGLNVYVAEPSIPATEVKGIIVIIPDAFGWEFVNNRILADHYAEMGKFRVYLPDFMHGTAAPVWSINTIRSVMKTGSLYDWIVKPYHIANAIYGFVPFVFHNRAPKSHPIVKSFFESLRLSPSPPDKDLPIGAAGFCWGGKHTLLLSHSSSTTIASGVEKPLIDAGFTGHPSMLVFPEDIENIVRPVSFALGDSDMNVGAKEIAVIQRVMEGKEELGGEVRVYVGAGHGFCVRADLAVEDSSRQAKEAEEQAVGFFKRCFENI
ncbi:dienelactone hydrolase family protein [Aspergillus cavernicola]|uniref:Dienelactone hydrolase family protein n=1 Tax=Aspergillus cavernicola TaxID=176166 RepID=A0ABR4II23_9EURO